MKSFLVFGSGGHGRVVGDLVGAAGHVVIGFADQDPSRIGESVDNMESSVRYWEEEVLQLVHRSEGVEGVDAYALGIGDNASRQQLLLRLGAEDVPALVHPAATVSPATWLGRGTVVLPTAVVNVGARIGEGVIVNTGAIVEHDCSLEDAVHVSPGAVLGGGVKVGQRSWIGAGATVIHGITIGRDVMVGAGSTVIRDVPDGTTVVGVPAKPIPGGP